MPTLIPTVETGAHARPVDLTHVDPAGIMPPTEREAFLLGRGHADVLDHPHGSAGLVTADAVKALDQEVRPLRHSPGPHGFEELA